MHNTCPRARACRTSAPTLQTTTSTRPDPQAAETTSPAAARYLHPLASTGRQQESVPTAAAAADKPPPRRALNRIEQPASGRSPFQASATACPPRAGASPAKAANSSIPFSRNRSRCAERDTHEWCPITSLTSLIQFHSLKVGQTDNLIRILITPYPAVFSMLGGSKRTRADQQRQSRGKR